MDINQCGHGDAPPSGRVCTHLLSKGSERGAYRWFTGEGEAYDLICAACRDDMPDAARDLCSVCQACFNGIRGRCYLAGFAGTLPVRKRASALSFAHANVDMRGALPARVVALRPLIPSPDGAWIALTATRDIVRLDPTARTVTTLATLPTSAPLADDSALHLSPDGHFAAIVETYGRRGIVIDLEAGAETMRLERDDYHYDVSMFPAAFFVHRERTLLIHGTAWNRLDISDSTTGRLLTAREPTSYEQGEARPPHYLDYFHGGLTISPNGEWIADNGWVWHPVGVVRTWNLRRWIEDNLWESEDGSTCRDICDHDDWDKPLCWIDNRRLAVWGYREPEPPVVRIFGVPAGREVSAFAGPLGDLIYDNYLFSFAPGMGTSVWDVETGERLLHDISFTPMAYHPKARQFITLSHDGAVRLSRLRDSDSTQSEHGAATGV